MRIFQAVLRTNFLERLIYFFLFSSIVASDFHWKVKRVLNGTGVDMPTGILDENGAGIGVTAAALTLDDVIQLYFSADKEYRERGVWLMNDETALALRFLKDDAGNYFYITKRRIMTARMKLLILSVKSS